MQIRSQTVAWIVSKQIESPTLAWMIFKADQVTKIDNKVPIVTEPTHEGEKCVPTQASLTLEGGNKCANQSVSNV